MIPLPREERRARVLLLSSSSPSSIPPVTTRLPRARRAPSPDRTPQGGWRTKGAGRAFHLSAGQCSGTLANGRSATLVVCRLGGAPCSVFRPLAWTLDSGGVGVDRLPRTCSASRPFVAGLDASALPGAVCGIQRRGLAPQGRRPRGDGFGPIGLRVMLGATHDRGCNLSGPRLLQSFRRHSQALAWTRVQKPYRPVFHRASRVRNRRKLAGTSPMDRLD